VGRFSEILSQDAFVLVLVVVLVLESGQTE